MEAKSTGKFNRSDIVVYWRSKGLHNSYIKHHDVSYSEKTGKAPQLICAFKYLDNKQALENAYSTYLLYQETDEDVIDISRILFYIQIDTTLEYKETVNYATL